MTTVAEITGPGVFELDNETYHAHPALSSSGARKLLPPSCPAIYRYERDHLPAPKKEYELGHAAHTLALGAGPELVLVDRERWDTKEVKAEVAAIRAAGNVPLKRAEYEQVHAMAEALQEHPRFGELFGDGGVAEPSLFWTDAASGVQCRARPDWLTPQRIVDYKTTSDASLHHVTSSVASYGYYIQAPWYLAGAVELDLVAPDAEFVFVFQSKTPPYLVSLVDIDEPGMRVGEARMRWALEIFRDCSEADSWPGYSQDIETISLPRWLQSQHGKEFW